MKPIAIEGFSFCEGGVCAAKGFSASGICCGLKKTAQPGPDAKKDLALIVSETLCTAAGMYTTNKVQGAPLTVTREHLQNGRAQAVIVNSVNANTCNADGIEKAQEMCRLAAKELNLPEEDVLVASTGVIGQPLPIEPIAGGIGALCKGLSETGNKAAVEAIMTTDTMPKEVAVQFSLGGKTCTLGGMLKGSGMIHPNMATTLTFLTTDACVSRELLQRALRDVVHVTLNRVSVDGDMSTNDMVLLLANGKAENACVKAEGEDFETLKNALYAVLMNLARMMARDGEGATKLLTCVCTGADQEETAARIAKSVIMSSLFKAAMFGEDANWGRVLCAIGYADAPCDIGAVSVTFASENGSVLVCEHGAGVPFSEETAKQVLSAEEIQVLIQVGSGEGRAIAWGCDLTYNYVKINGDYRS